jgi:hypothetical protein
MMLLAKTAAGGTDTTTLLIAVAGLTLAAASLAWQAATFALTGSRVKANIERGALGGGGLVTSPPDKWTANNSAVMAAQGFSHEVVAVAVRNVGRLPATVQKFSVHLDNGTSFIPIQTTPPLPYRLDAGGSEKWWVDAADVRALIAAGRLARAKVHIEVALGTGKTIKTKRIVF